VIDPQIARKIGFVDGRKRALIRPSREDQRVVDYRTSLCVAINMHRDELDAQTHRYLMDEYQWACAAMLLMGLRLPGTIKKPNQSVKTECNGCTTRTTCHLIEGLGFLCEECLRCVVIVEPA
jgi:hypothetical protein